MNWGEVLSVVVVGMVVVFLALIILIVAVNVMGWIFKGINGSKKNKITAKEANEPAKNTAAPTMDAKASEGGISGDIVAAITAAIACVLSSEGNTKPFTVKSIKRVRDARNPWNMAGIVDNTRPF